MGDWFLPGKRNLPKAWENPKNKMGDEPLDSPPIR
jgi:hypothetical protein